ncbi:MAG: type I glyceraldehyde-3-phosphate dehydrogenase [Kofleriaceae bacterium]|jgi:glyceraldehyde 3-phosphate dehydrogenase|nr:type I glyceraldehyde-3-phosphate dehydrogenase [Kofleriaceae bacterium]MBP6836834.1 type I glyceraldehyde-3-phosphate dehydrogenase [Kofleriaceae bacterium]MBP9205734.1 type I glyceraldehyde-3-phosphate dehydrogenase [Kofleriaceae bacterium]
MAKIRVGINGFGRIGRGFVRCLAATPERFDLVLINDLTDVATLGHLLRHDSVHGRYPGTVTVDGNALIINGDKVAISAEKDPAAIKWKDAGVDIVIESTGKFVDKEGCGKHLTGGARKVLISAPAKNPDVTLCCGINLEAYKPAEHHIISNASCTTNCLAPVAKVLQETFGVVSGLMTTIHSYTNDQQILDLPHKDLRRARAAALSMIPTTTGAAKALKEVLPSMAGKLDGMAIRVPTPNVSLVDLTARLEKKATAQEVNDAFRKAAAGPLKGILAVSDEPLVSCDYNGDRHSSTVDAALTTAIGDQVKVMAWYDNEMGYSQRLFDLAAFVAERL